MALEADQKADAKWTEIELLPEWEEEFYDVYTARKYGKWVMLKTLKKEFRDDPKCQEMIRKEFDVRYNLCHPNIVMINDLEDIPGVGLSIITDDVYGTPLSKLIKSEEISDDVLLKVLNQMVDAMAYVQSNHIVHKPLTADRVIFTEKIGNLKLIDVGFDQHNHLTAAAASEDIRSFGVILNEILDAYPTNMRDLRRVAMRCVNPDPRKRYPDIQALKLALTNQNSNRIYITIIAFLAVLVVALLWLTTHPGNLIK